MDIKELNARFPSDHSQQIDASYYIRNHPHRRGRHVDFMDLGTGPGHSYGLVMRTFEDVRWVGVDIENSPEVRKRVVKDDREFVSYDGVNLPFEDQSFDVVYSRQVFEHVRHPERVLAEIHRVLRPGGSFVGSVSQLEPYHSYSLWNFTYYGFVTLADSAGLAVVELRPGVDGLTLITRNLMKFQLKKGVEGFRPWFAADSPLNQLLQMVLGTEPDHRKINKAKVHYAGHICFKFERPA